MTITDFRILVLYLSRPASIINLHQADASSQTYFLKVYYKDFEMAPVNEYLQYQSACLPGELVHVANKNCERYARR